jgi:uncharacterized protein (TIGR03083 family)
MDQIVTKPELLDRLRREYARFQACLAQLTPEQISAPHTVRDWSVKDLVAHLIAHEQRALEELRAAMRGERLAIDHAAGDTFNAGAVAASRPSSAEAVLYAWRQSYAEVVAAVAALPDAYFDAAHPITAVLEDTIDGALANNTYDHYREHLPDLEQAIRQLQR